MYNYNQQDPVLFAVLMEQLPRVGKLAEIIQHIEVGIREPLNAYLETRKDELAVTNIGAATFVLTHTVQPFLHRVSLVDDADERRTMMQELIRMVTGYLLIRRPVSLAAR